MTFGHIWVLWLLAAIPLWAWWEWPRSLRRAGIVLKAAVFALILLELAEPRMTVFEQRMAVGVLADISASVPAPQVERERALVAGHRRHDRWRADAAAGGAARTAGRDRDHRHLPHRPGLRGTRDAALLRAALRARAALRRALIPPRQPRADRRD